MHRDDPTSSDDVASTVEDAASALVEVRHRDVDKPFFVNQDRECPMTVHLSHGDDNGERPMETEDNSGAVHHFLF